MKGHWNRRHFIGSAAGAAALFTTPGLYAELLRTTQPVGEGPFYPDKLPLDTDNDLLLINDSMTPSVGTIVHLTGRVLTAAGEPVRGAFVEIWQCDANGSYIHTQGSDSKQDKNFQGYGRFLTDSKGRYYFRTIRPVNYTLMGFFRTPHIHFAVSKNGRRVFTTQMLINGHKDNARDGLTQAVRDPEQLKTLLVDFKPLADSKIGEQTADFEIVLGRTLQELDNGTLGGVGRRRRG